MSIFYFILIFLFGLSVGSFLNVVVLRFDNFESIIKGRSHCPHCKKILKWYELIPFFSYLLLAGRCFSCKKNISIQYPIVELLTGLVFLGIFYYYGFSWATLILMVIFSLLILIGAYDAVFGEIPDILSYSAIFLVVFWVIFGFASSGGWRIGELWLPYIYGLAVGAGFFGLLVLVSKQKWMGLGDVFIGAIMGIFLGFPFVLVALFLAFVLGAIFSLILMLFKKKSLKDTVPFGPFLILATIIAFFWGEKIIEMYWTILL